MRCAVAILAMAVLAGGTWAVPPPAFAQQDGVYFDDPESPGGKEYSIPHERSRRDTAPAGAGGGDPLFGAGIQPEDGPGPSEGADGPEDRADADGVGDTAGAEGSGQAPGDASAGGPSEAPTPRDPDGGATEGGSSPGPQGREYRAAGSDRPELTLSALALGVVIAGGGLGLLLRRSRRDPAD
jgi:hypothetical protein